MNAIEKVRGDLDGAREKFAAVLPAHLDVGRFQQMVLNACAHNPRLLDCDHKSLLIAAMNAAQCGLEPAPELGQAYFVPRKGKVCFQVGYKGLLALAYRSDKVLGFEAQVVRDGDFFEYELGTGGFIKHRPAFNAGKATHAWGLAVLAGGHRSFDIMAFAEIEAIRGRSQADQGGFSPWKTDWDAMAKKTILRRLAKYLPFCTEMQRAIGIEEIHEAEGRVLESKTTADGLKEVAGLSAARAADLAFDEARIPQE